MVSELTELLDTQLVLENWLLLENDTLLLLEKCLAHSSHLTNIC